MEYQTNLTEIKTICLRNLRKKILEVYLGPAYKFKKIKDNCLDFSGPPIEPRKMEKLKKMEYEIAITPC